MAKAYWIIAVETHDPERYQDYVAAAKPAYEKYGAKFLVRGGDFDCPEGEAKPRNIVVEFASIEMARECYHSELYQRAAKIRQQLAVTDFLIIEGV
jgi:uncharacterized protein (DUF1330 family)